VTFDQFRSKVGRENGLNDFGGNPVIQEEAPADDACDRGDFHGGLFGDEVDDEDLVEAGKEEFDEGFVGFVWKVDVESGAVLEADDETMSEALGVVLGADVCAPLEGGDGFDLLFESDEGFLDLFDLLGLGVFFEFKANDVAILSGGFFCGDGGFLVMVGHGENGDEGGESDDELFHGAAV
jgi:hypothetical protein